MAVSTSTRLGVSATKTGTTMVCATAAPATASGRHTTITMRMPIVAITAVSARRITTSVCIEKVIGKGTSRATVVVGAGTEVKPEGLLLQPRKTTGTGA